MKAIAINGSPRKEGNTKQLIEIIFAELENKGVETEIVNIGGKPVRGCVGCNECARKLNQKCVFEDDDINLCVKKMAEADVIIIGSPVYFADVTPEIKALIDRAGRVGRANGNLFKRKIGASVAAVRRAGAIHALDSINHFFHIEQMICVGSTYWNLGVGREVGDIQNDEEGILTMKNLGQNIAWLLEKINK